MWAAVRSLYQEAIEQLSARKGVVDSQAEAAANGRREAIKQLHIICFYAIKFNYLVALHHAANNPPHMATDSAFLKLVSNRNIQIWTAFSNRKMERAQFSASYRTLKLESQELASRIRWYQDQIAMSTSTQSVPYLNLFP